MHVRHHSEGSKPQASMPPPVFGCCSGRTRPWIWVSGLQVSCSSSSEPVRDGRASLCTPSGSLVDLFAGVAKSPASEDDSVSPVPPPHSSVLYPGACSKAWVEIPAMAQLHPQGAVRESGRSLSICFLVSWSLHTGLLLGLSPLTPSPHFAISCFSQSKEDASRNLSSSSSPQCLLSLPLATCSTLDFCEDHRTRHRQALRSLAHFLLSRPWEPEDANLCFSLLGLPSALPLPSQAPQ